ncbi:MAG TPA: zf-HC2 domain-containing protein [Ktedonobacterales bacterium]
MTHSDSAQWERQRELLSAHLDGALEPKEDAALGAHLSTCADCQHELAALRQTRALVHALPSPALPRSFTLPDTIETRRGRIRPVPGWARPTQQLGGIAAMIGAALLCASALPAFHFGASGPQFSAAAPRASSHNSSQSYGGASTAPANTTTAPAQADQGTKHPAPTPTGVAVTSAPKPVEQSQPFPVLPVSGGVLLVGGIGAAVAGGIARRRPRDAR